VARVAREQPDTLFVITGDHYGRRFPNRHPDAWERTAVPGILVGPAITGRTLAATCGSHLDLIPTLVELCAPAGFPYHAVGVDLFREAQHQAATAAGALTRAGALEWNNLGDDTTGDARKNLEQLRADRAAFGWWRLTHGAQVP
jgi:phosphoglycerol transferase MdoB-like AlkP superfamily enzyme